MEYSLIHRYWMIIVRECRELVSRPMYLITMVLVPVFLAIFFLSLMDSGTPTDMPVATVDNDNTKTSRNIIHTLDAFKANEVVFHAKDFNEARQAMKKGEIYGIYYIPNNFEKNLLAFRQPTVSFYTNSAFLIPGSLLMSDMKTMSVLSQAAVGKSVLEAKGATKEQVTAILQPIAVDCHPIGNPWLNYSVYLNNILLPGIYNILIMILTVYILGQEVKLGKSRGLLRIAHNDIGVAITAKLIPITALLTLMTIAMNVVLYKYLGFPCKCGIGQMMINSFLLVISSQSMAIFYFGLIPITRYSLSMAAFWSVLSISLSGFTFPVSAMHPTLQMWANFFPLHPYFNLYVDQALNGRSLYYTWINYVLMLIMTLLPIFVMPNLRRAYREMKYIP
jgi:ABC-2 type transport system permease protein